MGLTRQWRGWRDTILDESSTAAQTREALDELAEFFSSVGGIEPDRSFAGWRDDAFLAQGVAINPGAAAFCLRDYQRSAFFMRGVYAALATLRHQFVGERLRILYAGCGPFALQLLPLLEKFAPGCLEILLLDIHQESLDSVAKLLAQLAPGHDRITCIRTDASVYQHTAPLHLIIAETMQKSLEQEPQFAVTANLAPQLAEGGIFIPERIEVELCLANLEQEKILLERGKRINAASLAADGQRLPLATLFCLEAKNAAPQLASAMRHSASSRLEIDLGAVGIPVVGPEHAMEAVLFTRIQVYDHFYLHDYDCQLTLPSRPPELSPLRPNSRFRASYQLGTYPRLAFRELPAPEN
jgi:hypothetical protein